MSAPDLDKPAAAALPGEVWQDVDGCCLTPNPMGDGWVAFGRTEPLLDGDLTGNDVPVRRLLVQGGGIAPERVTHSLDDVLGVLHRVAEISAGDPEASRAVLSELAESLQRQGDKDERLLRGQDALDADVYDAEREALVLFCYVGPRTHQPTACPDCGSDCSAPVCEVDGIAWPCPGSVPA